MIKLIYPVIVADSEVFLAALKKQNIVIKGMSTIESPDVPQTLVFVADDMPNATKLQIDTEIKATPKKAAPVKPPKDAPVVKEEVVVDELRTI